MKTAFAQFVPTPAAPAPATGMCSAGCPDGQATAGGLKGEGLWNRAPAAAAAPKAVSIERKPTIFYPIGWLAIIGITGWFTWMILG